MIYSIVTLLMRGVADPFRTRTQGKNYAGLIMQITMSIIVGIPHYAHFFVVITNVRSKRKRKKLFGNIGLRKKFQKTRDIDIYWQEDYFENFEWERQSEKIFYVEKFFGKITKTLFREGEVGFWATKRLSGWKGIIVCLFPCKNTTIVNYSEKI